MKITQEQQKQGQELVQTLVEKAWKNATFKEQLISNPEATIEKVTGIKANFSKETEIKVEDQTDSNIIYLNIPQKVNLDNFELTDEQLEMVSGGFVFIVAGLLLAAFIGGVELYGATHK